MRFRKAMRLSKSETNLGNMNEDFRVFRKGRWIKDYYLSQEGYIIFAEKYHLKEVIVVKVTVNIVHIISKEK